MQLLSIKMSDMKHFLALACKALTVFSIIVMASAVCSWASVNNSNGDDVVAPATNYKLKFSILPQQFGWISILGMEAMKCFSLSQAAASKISYFSEILLLNAKKN